MARRCRGTALAFQIRKKQLLRLEQLKPTYWKAKSLRKQKKKGEEIHFLLWLVHNTAALACKPLGRQPGKRPGSAAVPARGRCPLRTRGRDRRRGNQSNEASKPSLASLLFGGTGKPLWQQCSCPSGSFLTPRKRYGCASSGTGRGASVGAGRVRLLGSKSPSTAGTGPELQHEGRRAELVLTMGTALPRQLSSC